MTSLQGPVPARLKAGRPGWTTTAADVVVVGSGIAGLTAALRLREATNLLTISTALAEAARLREETRGSHWREDFPDRDDDRWAGHIDTRLTDAGLDLSFRPSPSSVGGAR